MAQQEADGAEGPGEVADVPRWGKRKDREQERCAQLTMLSQSQAATLLLSLAWGPQDTGREQRGPLDPSF